jgi:hypothetical protein
VLETLPAAPTVPVPENALPPSTELPPLELELTSNQQHYDGQLRRFVSLGNVMMRVAGARLMADRLEYDPESRSIYAFGSVRFQRGQQYLQASRLRYSLLEGIGEMEDAYGVLDLDGSQQDLDLAAMPTAPLPEPQPISCPPDVPPPPQWHPHPWAVTAWGGQAYAANFGDTFTFNGSFRPEYLAGIGLQRRILDAGPLALEIDGNLLGHHAAQQRGGPFNQAVPFSDTPSQTFAEGTVGIGLRLWVRPWLSLYFVEGLSLLTQPSNYEKTFRESYSVFLNYLAFEVEAKITPQWSAVGRIHHRSGAYGTYFGVSEGSNAYLLGLRHRFGDAPITRTALDLPPAQGCPGAPPPTSTPPSTLDRQLESVTMGPGGSGGPAAEVGRPGSAAVGAEPPPRGNVWSRARAQERARSAAIARIDQRVEAVTFQQSLVAERRFGSAAEPTNQARSQFGEVRPAQLVDLGSRENRQLVRGSLSRWRIQARRLRFTPTTLSGDRVAFSNDPFTPAQSWMDSENVVATLQPNGDTVIKAERNRLLLEDRLPIPVTRSTTISKQEEVTNRWVLGVDRDDRDGFYLGYDVPIRLGEKATLTFQPQFMLERAIDGSTDSYPPPGAPVGSSNVTQPATTGDLFGFESKLLTPLVGNVDLSLNLDVSTLDPENIPDGTRSWGQIDSPVNLPLVGESRLRLFGAYRFRIWNGSLGDQDVYTAYGASLEKEAALPAWGRLSGNYFWRLGLGNYQANAFDSDNLAELWRANAIGSLNFSLALWTGKPAPLTPDKALANAAVPVVPGLRLNANLLGTAAYFGDGTNQNTLTLSGGPTLTLGHFVKPFLDYTAFTITGSATVRQGVSPFSFDRAVDLGTLGIGLTQQIAGPLLFSGGVGLNVDPGSEFYGDVTDSYLELRWQRRAYEIGVFYSPYNGLGGVRVKLNDFNFKGPGLPFVPHHPTLRALDRPF